MSWLLEYTGQGLSCNTKYHMRHTHRAYNTSNKSHTLLQTTNSRNATSHSETSATVRHHFNGGLEAVLHHCNPNKVQLPHSITRVSRSIHPHQVTHVHLERVQQCGMEKRMKRLELVRTRLPSHVWPQNNHKSTYLDELVPSSRDNDRVG